MPSIGCVANIYNEVNALPGWLEAATAFFDDVRVMHAGPGGKMSTDGTIEILEKWKIPIEYCAIDDGFGIVRSKTIRLSPCDYVAILDADERVFRTVPLVQCDGENTPPDVENMVLQQYDTRDKAGVPANLENLHLLGVGLRTKMLGVLDQHAFMREIVSKNEYDVIQSIRRHWHDFTWKKPTQNWLTRADPQWRILRNDPSIYFDPAVKMHEQVIGVNRVYRATPLGPYIDHFHLHFKRMEIEQRAEDIRTYDALAAV